jgi:ABC-type transport system involved in multi-copper enzyme maturation permease subunit
MTGRLLRRGLAGFLALLLGVAVFELVQPVVADSLGGPRGLEPFLRALPPALQALTRTRPEFIAVSGLAGYLSLGFTHPLYLVLASATVVGFACRGLAGEMERGTIQLALARPISRPQVYLARVAGVVIVALALAAAGPLGMTLGLAVARPEGEFAYRHFLPVAVATGLLVWAIGGLTLLGSAAASTTGRAVAWATAGLVVFYFVDYFASLWAFLEPLEPFSIFDYYDPAQALVYGALVWSDTLALLLVGLAGVLGGLVVFVRRDLPT